MGIEISFLEITENNDLVIILNINRKIVITNKYLKEFCEKIIFDSFLKEASVKLLEVKSD